ncbi:glycoside hydrolase family 3 N-terminal domain-containing protein [Psychromicrobium sp. YIM B11713]|uniref:glycoside hydrolase family 3 N-terminal domain-containing protein n=1 Tax=Psychromicrobium sp. YIM B11713 TaxID=3145233 RepID=UPI00374F3000
MTRKRLWLIISAAVLAVLVAFAVIFGLNASGMLGPNPAASNSGSSSSPALSPSSLPVSSSATASSSTSTSSAPTSSAPSQSPAQLALAKLTLEQKVGQVLMVSSPVGGADADTLAALQTMHIGNVFLKGRSYAGSQAVATVIGQLKSTVNAETTGGIKQFVATDQEGGLVQIMNGPGFSAMPSAIEQAALGPVQLKAEATVWGKQLAAAGVNVNFGPVLDTVPSAAFAPQNAPIGHFGRQYGYTPQAVSGAGVAAALGFASGGVAPTVKHFPGLGRVTANTDVASGVTDSTTSRNDPYLLPFKDAVKSGVRWVMVSNALYPRIDVNNIAPFSPAVINGMLRGDLGFSGVVVSDDICDAVQLSPYPVSARGANFIAAGGTMALCTNQSLLPEMYQGILQRSKTDPAFAKLVDAAALKVLEIKAQSGLL